MLVEGRLVDVAHKGEVQTQYIRKMAHAQTLCSLELIDAVVYPLLHLRHLLLRIFGGYKPRFGHHSVLQLQIF